MICFAIANNWLGCLKYMCHQAVPITIEAIFHSCALPVTGRGAMRAQQPRTSIRFQTPYLKHRLCVKKDGQVIVVRIFPVSPAYVHVVYLLYCIK